MSCAINLQDLPPGVFESVSTPENIRGRGLMSSVTALSFPKSRSALWDGRPAGQKLRLQLCTHRKPRLVLMEKALRLAQRHARQSNKRRLLCFFLGSVSVDADEEGVTLTLDRFDPGRDQAGSSDRIPSALLPGDVLVPCLFSSQTSDAVVQSEAELHRCFKALQQCVSSRQTLDLGQLIKVRGHVFCSQQCDAAMFSLSWSSVCPSIRVDVQPVQPVPIIPTALLRSLTSIKRPLPHAASRQRGFLTMDQTRKLLLMLESDPKTSTLPLVGLWLSGVTHVYNPQVWTWCLRFLFSSTLQDRVLSESGCFLLVLFGSTHRAPQFFQCRGPGSGAQMDYQLLSASQSVTLYQQAICVEGQTLRCDLGSEDLSGQTQVFRDALSSFNSLVPPTVGLSISDQDSGVDEEDLSPRPSPSPHLPAYQSRRVQPSVPELSLLIDSSFSSNHSSWQNPGPTHNPELHAPPPGSSSSTSSAPIPHLHSTPNPALQQPCSCCSSHTYSCTSIYCSTPALHHAPPHHAPPHHAPPPASPPPNRSDTPPLPPASPPPCQTPLPLSCFHPPPSSKPHPAPSPSSKPHPAPPPSSKPHPAPSSFRHQTVSPPLPSCHQTPPPPCDSSHSPVSLHMSAPPLTSNQCPSCSDQVVGGTSPDTYQLLLHQDQQLRLLQAQVQMLLEAQGKLQAPREQVETQTPARSTASIAVGTGASLFWGDPWQPLPHQESPPTSSPSPASSPTPPLHADSSIVRSTEDPKGQQEANRGLSGLQSPVLGESVSMLRPSEEQSFYHSLMNQLTSRLQDPDCTQEEESRRSSQPAPPDLSQSSSSLRRQQSCGSGDPVVSATLRQLQQLGVDMDVGDLSEADRRKQQTVESSSTLAAINPVAVLSRLSVSEPSSSSLYPGGSVDLSLEANAIALRYLSDSQLSRLSLGGHAPKTGPASSCSSLLSPSNMSLATRKYMKRYGLIEEEEEDDNEEQEASTRLPLSDALNVKLLPQSQLIRDLKPKMQLLADSNKENCSSRPPSLVRASSRQTEGSVGNILDLSRLRQLPKLF